MTEHLSSIVMATRNKGEALAVTLESITSQRVPFPFEVIVVDDGSTDSTPAVLGAFEPRLTYICQPQSGPAAARNLGIQWTRGELVAFLDADDVWLPEKLSLQARRLHENPGLDLCFTRYFVLFQFT